MQELSFLSHLAHWQIDFAAFALLLSSALFTIVPEELVFVTLGFLARFGRIHPVEAILVAHLGLIPADTLTVWFGRKLGQSVLTRRPFCFLFAKKSVHRALEKLKTRGNVLLFVSRFMPMLRAPVYLAAGISGVSLRRSTLIDLGAALIQVTSLVLLGYFLGLDAKPLMSVYAWVTPAMAVIFLLSLAIKAVRRPAGQPA